MDTSIANTSVSEVLTDDLLSTSLENSMYKSSEEENEDSDYNEPIKNGGKISKQRLQRKELRHALQILRLELSQKNTMIDNLRSEYTIKMDDMEDKLGDALHQKEVIQTQMEAQLQMLQDNSKTRTEKINDDMVVIQERQHALELANIQLQTHSSQIHHTLSSIDNFGHLYDDIKDRNPYDMTLQHYAVVSTYVYCNNFKHNLLTACYKT